MRAKRIPLPGNPTGAHRDLSITSKENVLSNVLHKENTMKVADANALKNSLSLSDRKGDYAFYLTVICYKIQRQALVFQLQLTHSDNDVSRKF